MKSAQARNAWLIAARKNAVAECVDELAAKPDKTPTEKLVWILGISWLDGTLAPEPDLFASLFGSL